jgi:ribosomal protein S18 acetylase RimI-like enzyme
MTVEVRRLRPDDWQIWRAVRLAALADAPHAFGSTLAREQALDEAAWRDWLQPDNGVAVVALSGADPVGAIGIYLFDGKPYLISAWVHTEARGRGVGDNLVTEALDWSREQGHDRVVLRVADGNDAARRLFVRNGFTPTGERKPLESDPTVGTEYMARELS